MQAAIIIAIMHQHVLQPELLHQRGRQAGLLHRHGRQQASQADLLRQRGRQQASQKDLLHRHGLQHQTILLHRHPDRWDHLLTEAVPREAVVTAEAAELPGAEAEVVAEDGN